MLGWLPPLHATTFPLGFAFFAGDELSHADPVVPILIASSLSPWGPRLVEC
jgi:hypothetical protein